MSSTTTTTTSSNSTTCRFLTLKTQDNVEFRVEEEVATQSQAIKNMVEDGCGDGTIPLPPITSPTMAKIIEWCEKHKDQNPDDTERNKLEEWDSEFLNVDTDTLYDLIMASNFLDIKVLLDQVCAKVASLIKGKTPEQIRTLLGIKNDFTPEEEHAIRQDNAWAFQ